MKTKRITARAYLGERGHTGFKRCRTVAGHAVTDCTPEQTNTIIKMERGKVVFVKWKAPAGALCWDVWTNAFFAEEDFLIWTKRTPKGFAWSLKECPFPGDFKPAKTLHRALAAAIAAHKENATP